MRSHQTNDSRLSAVERMAASVLRSYRGCHASAIRLFGTADQYISPENIIVRYGHTPYEIPEKLIIEAEDRIARKKALAKQKGKLFFDGPNVQVMHWASIHLNHDVGTAGERHGLQFTLGPVGWYQFEGTNALIAERLNQEEPRTYEDWVEFSQLINDCDLRHNKLSNILCSTITIFTRDGKIGFGERGDKQSSVPNRTSCAVAENINRYFDEVDREDTGRLINPVPYERKPSEGPDNTYEPRDGVPHPAAAVRRGLNDETSRHMTDHIPDLGIKLTGLDFGLDTLQPYALWLALVTLTAEEFKQKCMDDPGKASDEQEIKFVTADFDAQETQEVLNRTDWVPGGKASFVRAIELIDALKPEGSTPTPEVFDILANAGERR